MHQSFDADLAESARRRRERIDRLAESRLALFRAGFVLTRIEGPGDDETREAWREVDRRWDEASPAGRPGTSGLGTQSVPTGRVQGF